MQKQYSRISRSGTTLVELVVAIALMAVIMASVFPLIGNMRNTWDINISSIDTLQNGRALIYHMDLHLIQAQRITSVSPVGQVLGYIEFEDNEGDTFRYDVDADGFVDFGVKGSPKNLVGPVSQLQFTCYDINDTPTTNAEVIRLVKVQATVTDPAALVPDKVFSTSFFLPVCYESKYKFDPDTGKAPALAQIDTSHYLCAYEGKEDDGWAVVLNVDTSLWTLSQGAALEFDTTKGQTPALAQIDTSHYLCAYTGDSDDGYARVLAVDSYDWTINNGAAFKFDATQGKTPALVQIDPNNYLCAYEGNGEDGWAAILTLDPDTWTLTNTGTLEFDDDKGKTPALAKIDDSHYLCAYTGDDDEGWAVILKTTSGPEGLVGHWKLDETSGTTAYDSSGNSIDGTLINMYPTTDWVTGQIGNALDFDGYNDYVTAANSASLQLTSALTITGWVKMDAFGSSTEVDAILRKGEANPNNYQLAIMDQKVCLQLDGSDGSSASGVTAGNTGLNTDQWYFVAGSWDGSVVRIFVNGVLDNTPAARTGNIPTDNRAIYLGGRPGEDYLDGVVDDVRLYDYGLSEAEITALYVEQMGPVFQEFTEAKLSSNGTSITIATPSGTNQGDLLIASVATDGSTALSLAAPTGGGWTKINSSTYGGNVTQGVWAKLAGSAESEPTNHTFTWSGSEQAYGSIIRITGHDPADPIHAWAASGTLSSNPTSPAVTTSVDNCMILRLGAFDHGDITVDSPGLTGHTPITMDSTQGLGVNYEGFTEAKLATDGTSLTINTPPGTSAGDLLVAALASDGESAKNAIAPSGWTNIEKDSESKEAALHAWWKLAGSGEPGTQTFTWTDEDSEQAYGWIMRFTGIDPSKPVDQKSKKQDTSISPVSKKVDTSVDMSVVLRMGGFDGGDITLDNPGLGDCIPITMDKSSSTVGNCSGGAGYFQKAIKGSGVESNFALTASHDYVTITAEIQASAGATPTDNVSGGAGYKIQSVMGSSGISSFALTDSEEARMVTLAIAPAPEGSSGSGSGSGSGTLTLSKETPFRFDADQGETPALIQIDSTHYLCAYAGDKDEGWAVVLIVNPSSWTITKGTRFCFDAEKGKTPALTQIDASHFLCAYEGDGEEGWAVVLNVNTSTWTISKGNTLPYDSDKAHTPALIRINTNHHLCAYEGKEGAGFGKVIDPTSSGLKH